MKCRNNWVLFFVTVIYLEKKMERLNSQWHKEEETRKDFRIVLNIQEQFFICELFKDTLDTILVILHYRTMLFFSEFFQYIYHVGCAINLHSVINSGLSTWRSEFEQGQTDGFHHSLESHGQNHKDRDTIRTRYIGSTSILLWRKDWSSIEHDRTLSSSTIHSQLIVPEGYHDGNWRNQIRGSKYMRHFDLLRRFLFKDNWMKEFGSEVARGNEDSQQTQPKNQKSEN